MLYEFTAARIIMVNADVASFENSVTAVEIKDLCLKSNFTRWLVKEGKEPQ